MYINVYSIEKSQNSSISELVKEYIKMSSRYAKVNDRVLFDKKISKIQNPKEAKRAYSSLYLPYLDGVNVSLDVEGESLTSLEFAKILENCSKINFFIGGAYGLERGFLSKSQKIISLSRLTYAHKIAKVVLFEQIYRGLSILNSHPYHK